MKRRQSRLMPGSTLPIRASSGNWLQRDACRRWRGCSKRAAHCKVRNPFGMFVSSLWINFATACRTDTHGYHCWDEIDVNSYERRETTPLGAETRTFWRSLSDAGRSVAVIDVPHSCAGAAIDGIQVAGWGAHDRHFGLHSWPPKKAGEIEAQFGLHPLFGMNAHRPHQFAPDDYAHREGPLRTQEEDIVLFDSLTRGVGAKREVECRAQGRARLGPFPHGAWRRPRHRPSAMAPPRQHAPSFRPSNGPRARR